MAIRKGIVTLIIGIIGTATLQACPSCRPAVEAAVYNAEFAGNLLTLLLPILGLIVLGVIFYFKNEYPTSTGSNNGK